VANWVSKDGILYPAKERVSLKNNSGKVLINPSAKWSKFAGEEVQSGDDFIYEGEDRAALFTLFKDKVEVLGQDFHKSIEMVNLARQLGYKDVAAYAKAVGYDVEQAQKNFDERASVTAKHELPARAKEVMRMGGGADTTGGGADIIGGFGDERVRPASELDE
jgi:hypothetical protein